MEPGFYWIKRGNKEWEVAEWSNDLWWISQDAVAFNPVGRDDWEIGQRIPCPTEREEETRAEGFYYMHNKETGRRELARWDAEARRWVFPMAFVITEKQAQAEYTIGDRMPDPVE